MPAPPTYEVEFVKACTDQKFVDADRANRGFKIQGLLAATGIAKPLGDIFIEAGWMRLDQAGAAIETLKKAGFKYPDLRMRLMVPGDQATFDKLSAEQKKQFEALGAAVGALGYIRPAAALAADKFPTGIGAAPPDLPRPEGGPKRGTTRRGPPGATARVNPVTQKIKLVAGISAAVILPLAVFMAYKMFKPKGDPELEEIRRREALGIAPPPPVAPRPTPTKSAAPTPTPEPTMPPDPSSGLEADPERQKKWIAEQEQHAQEIFIEAKRYMNSGDGFIARRKFKLLRDDLGWTAFAKLHKDEIAAQIAMVDRIDGKLDGTTDTSNPGSDTYDTRKTERTEKAKKNAKAAQAAMEKETAADIKRTKAAKLRLKNEKLDIALRNGQLFKGAAIVDFTPDDLKIQSVVDGNPADVLVDWDALDNASFLAVHRLIAKGQGAEGQYAVGCEAVKRQLWKDAQAAFAECAKDAALKARVPDLSAVLAAKGAPRRMGPDTLSLTYEAFDTECAKDLRETTFDRDVFIDLVPGAGELQLGLFSSTIVVPALDSVHVSVRNGIYRVTAGGKEIQAGVVEGKLQGRLTLGGTLPKRVSIEGRVLPADLVKRTGAADLLVQAANQNDFTRKPEYGVAPLTGEDDYFLPRLPEASREDFKKVRAQTVEALRRGGLDPNLGKLFDKLIEVAPDYAPAWYWRGVYRQLAGRLPEARIDFTFATMRNPDFAEAQAAAAACSLEEGDLEKAAAQANEALKRLPDQALAMAVQGTIRFLQGDPRMAQTDLELAARLASIDEPAAWLTARRALNAVRGPVQVRARQVKELARVIVFTDGPSEKAIPHGERLEAAFNAYVEMFKGLVKEDLLSPKIRLTVLSSRDVRMTYTQLLGHGIGDPVHSDALRHEVVVADGAEISDADWNAAACGQFMSMIATSAPVWMKLGFAERGTIPPGVLKPMKQAQRASTVSLQQVMARAGSDFTAADVLHSWSLAPFFMKASQRPLFDPYFKKILEGKDAATAFDTTFNAQDIQRLEMAWGVYVEKLEGNP